MKIYTKTGDLGETSLLGGKRVKKNCIEMEAIGEVDELNSSLGVLLSGLSLEENETILRLKKVQNNLFVIGSQLAAVQTDLVKVPELSESEVKSLEDWIDQMSADLPELTQFILPGGTVPAAESFMARAICRRAERQVVGLAEKHKDLVVAQQYLNRLSDALFVLARFLNIKAGEKEVFWEK
ncbi:MAG: cob(I)yrinic acid a,c-diamide adenosyltransferase [Candidatus Magasanikbacteria bacterium]|nr:cob(I)yrinic acid a,c-diamide adenosyltransferase [Candidatus Magasanikbacteria bacterium]